MEKGEDPLHPSELARPPKRQPDLGDRIAKWVFIVAVLTVPLIRYLDSTRWPRVRGQLTACCSHVKDVAAALEMYATDNDGHYPAHLDQLLPNNYLKEIPTCPAAGRMTFTDYQISRDPDNFSFSCAGDNHARAYAKSAPNYPRYSATQGLENPL